MAHVSIAANGNSKEIQTAGQPAFRFGQFELNAAERLLTRRGSAVALPPKAFDALLLLVQRAEHLVRKSELMEALWPSTYVGEANLTNVIVCLRKVLGRDAIQTVSRHGYRFTSPVDGEPGIAFQTYQRFVEAKELVRQKSLPSLARARDLLFTCIAENPGFSLAWAWLGRCCWILGKFGENGTAAIELSETALRRAFSLDPDLSCAHQFYTPVQTDTGRAFDALARLAQRICRNGGDPESLTGLVQVLRFCGLLDESAAAHQRAIDLDPTACTSLSHTLFLMGDYAGAIDSYGGKAGYYLDAASWAALGDSRRAATLLRERLDRTAHSELMSSLLASLLAIAEHQFEEASRCMERMTVVREPEVLVYFARHYSYIGKADAAVRLLRQAANSGFVCAPSTLECDPWLENARADGEFPLLLDEVRRLLEKARPLYTELSA